MAKWYRVLKDSIDIDEYSVARESEKTITYERTTYNGSIDTSRVSKVSEWQRWFPSWEEARDYIEANLLRKIDVAKKDVTYNEERLETVRQMVPPGSYEKTRGVWDIFTDKPEEVLRKMRER